MTPSSMAGPLAGLDRRIADRRTAHHPRRRSSSRARTSSSRRSSRGSAVLPTRLPDVARSLRLGPHRLPAVTRTPDRERADRGRRGPRPHPVRVLRPRGPQPVDRHGRISFARTSIPTSRSTGVVLTMYDARTNLSADVAAEVRKHLGAARVRDGRPAQRPPLRSAQPRAADRALRARRRRARRPTSSSPRSFAAAARRSVPSPRTTCDADDQHRRGRRRDYALAAR